MSLKLPTGLEPMSKTYKVLILPIKLQEHFYCRASSFNLAHLWQDFTAFDLAIAAELALRVFLHMSYIFFSTFNTCLSTVK